MKISFNINYYTEWGQNLFVCGSLAILGHWNESKALPMRFQSEGNWTADCDVNPDKDSEIHYKFFLKDERNGLIFWEWGRNRTLKLSDIQRDAVSLFDFWKSAHLPENALLSAAFTNNLFRRSTEYDNHSDRNDYTHRVQLVAPRIGRNMKFCIIGSNSGLGNWEPKKAVIMDDREYPVWRANVKCSGKQLEIAYKYGIYDVRKKEIVCLENGPDRVLIANNDLPEKRIFIQTDEHFRYDSDTWKGAGIALPIFSLRSKHSFGVGEFLDLKLLIDWTASTGLKLIQVLPINDTIATHTWKDSYPYAAISVLALHPIYLNLPAMGTLSDDEEMEQFTSKGKDLNSAPIVEYEAVMKLKSEFYKKLYEQTKEELFRDSDFRNFFNENKNWLAPYAAFSCLRDRFKTPEFKKWPAYSTYCHEEIRDFVSPKSDHFDDVAVHYFIQYHLHKQLTEVAEYAREKGVVLKGDIPIGIYRHSVDAWMEPRLYNMDKQAGAPPDAYSATGQNWRFPTYNWEEMAKDNYHWWKKRLMKMADYFDAYRIDHILGFFRIWEIPEESIHGLMGRFNPAIPLYLYEIEGHGVHFDYERFCRPYIRDYMLTEIFGQYKDEVRKKYLDQVQDDAYHLKPQFDTQRKVEHYFSNEIGLKSKPAKEKIKRIKDGLMELIGNVLFFEGGDSDGQHRQKEANTQHGFHPKIGMHYTYSFKDLNPEAQQSLDRIYIHYFYQRQEQFWREKAMVKLPAIMHATNMLVCGEDLGMVPNCVPGVMDELGILNLEIQRMPKNSDQKFSSPHNAKYLSVVSPSCHDMSTIRAWWEENREVTQEFYNEQLDHSGEAPYFCEPWICREINEQHLNSPAMWAIFPIQDLVAMDEKLRYDKPQEEQINVPSNSEHYWKFRFHLNIEDLMKAKSFNRMISEMLTTAGRGREY